VTDHEARQLARILLDAAQSESDAGRGFTVPAGVLPDLLPARRLEPDVAARLIGIERRVWAQESKRHRIVRDIVRGTRRHHRGRASWFLSPFPGASLALHTTAGQGGWGVILAEASRPPAQFFRFSPRSQIAPKGGREGDHPAAQPALSLWQAEAPALALLRAMPGAGTCQAGTARHPRTPGRDGPRLRTQAPEPTQAVGSSRRGRGGRLRQVWRMDRARFGLGSGP
jgi:hypothetical protein